MSNHLAWYVARGSGIVAWGLLITSMIWGLLYATCWFGLTLRPWWMLGMHRFLSALSLAFIGVHIVALIADSFIDFAVVDVLVPFHSPWRNTAVGIGIIAMWMAVAIEVTSLAQRRLPRVVWRRIHLASYGVFALATIHSLSAGTDTRTVVAGGSAIAVGAAAVLIGTVLWVARSTARVGRVTAWETSSVA